MSIEITTIPHPIYAGQDSRGFREELGLLSEPTSDVILGWRPAAFACFLAAAYAHLTS